MVSGRSLTIAYLVLVIIMSVTNGIATFVSRDYDRLQQISDTALLMAESGVIVVAGLAIGRLQR